MSAGVPANWTFAASAFNWTPDVLRAERTAPDVSTDIVRDGVADVIELELGQLWRSFPELSDAEIDALRADLDDAGGTVSIAGVAIDDWTPGGRRRQEGERLAFLLPQLRAAHRAGARGVRLPIGQAGEPLLRRLLPVLAELDLTLYEEIQGQQTPQASHIKPSIDVIATIDDPRVRVLVDTSMLMPALPITYLQAMADALPPDLLTRLTEAWLDPATPDAVQSLLRSEVVPTRVHTMYMNLLLRFGRSTADVLRDILPLVGAFHLKFWDLDDADGRVARPIRDLGALLREAGWRGTLCSEWGGHEWMHDADATDMTRRHLALARETLAD